MSSTQATNESEITLDSLAKRLLREFDEWAASVGLVEYQTAIARADAMLLRAEFEHADQIPEMVMADALAMTQMLATPAETVTEAMIASFEQSVIREMYPAVLRAAGKRKRL